MRGAAIAAHRLAAVRARVTARVVVMKDIAVL